jgi:hypothetical protein
MAIMPLSLLICRIVFKAPRVARGNLLERLGLEVTFPLMGGILIGYVLLHRAPELALPVIAATIGTRYFMFRTLYGDLAYWVVGGALCAAATLGLLGLHPPAGNLALVVAVIELIGAGVLLSRWKRRRG